MKRILTSNIQENVRRQPFSKASIEHFQEAFAEVFTAILKNLTSDTINFFRLHGLVNSGAGTDYDISAGAVYYNGEVYLVDAFAGSHATQVPVLNFETTFRAGDPVKFTDNNDFNVHEIKKMVITLADTGTGSVDFSALQVIGQGWVTNSRMAAGAVSFDKIDDTVARHYSSPGNGVMNDFNDAKTGGISHGHGGLPNAPAGATDADTFLLIVTDSRKANGETVQTAIQLTGASGGGAGTLYTRIYQSIGDSWSAWTQL